MSLLSAMKKARDCGSKGVAMADSFAMRTPAAFLSDGVRSERRASDSLGGSQLSHRRGAVLLGRLACPARVPEPGHEEHHRQEDDLSDQRPPEVGLPLSGAVLRGLLDLRPGRLQ